MPLRRFQIQYEQLAQFNSGRHIGMTEVGRSARRKARQLGNSDCVVGNCHWDQGLSVFSNHTKTPGLRTIGITAPIACATLEAHPSTSLFGVEPRARKLDCSGFEPGRL
ncbi:hypothetical protein TNCV_553101 [Trichonephila clavipes]|nr:hypothetical protein TNCV_553101 [Trichonephila clavipes]